MAKHRTPEEYTCDPAAEELLAVCAEEDLSLTAFGRADELKPCPIGARGYCCKICAMGPCRVTKGKDGQTGVCGATVDTIVARNFARMVAAGSSAHSDHGRDLAYTLKAVAEGEAPDYQIRDPLKLKMVAEYLDIEAEGRPILELA